MPRIVKDSAGAKHDLDTLPDYCPVKGPGKWSPVTGERLADPGPGAGPGKPRRASKEPRRARRGGR